MTIFGNVINYAEIEINVSLFFYENRIQSLLKNNHIFQKSIHILLYRNLDLINVILNQSKFKLLYYNDLHIKFL